MNKLYPFAVLVLFWTIGGEFSKAQAPEATLRLEQEVAHLKRNLTALWKLVRILQAQIIVQSHGGPGVPTHTISGPDHLDTARSRPGTGGKRVHVHFHDGHLHLHETSGGRRYNATHAHSEHSHRHGDHYHFHDDMGNAPPHGTPEDHGGMHRHGDHWHYAGGTQPQQPQRTTPGPDSAESVEDVADAIKDDDSGTFGVW